MSAQLQAIEAALHHMRHGELIEARDCLVLGAAQARKASEAVATPQAVHIGEAACFNVNGVELPLLDFVGMTGFEVKRKVLAKARSEGFTGTADERLAELGWSIRPLFIEADTGGGES